MSRWRIVTDDKRRTFKDSSSAYSAWATTTSRARLERHNGSVWDLVERQES